MPSISSSPYKQRPASPLPPPPPPKAIDLNSSTKSTDRETGAKITRRAFLCDVVIEQHGEETASLLAYLGQPLAPLSTLPPPPITTSSRPATPSRLSRSFDSDDEDDENALKTSEWSLEKKEDMARRLGQLIEELVRTERSYYNRVEALKKKYADPLRRFAKDPNHQLIPLYEANTLFANIDSIVPASAAFLSDLEIMFLSREPEVPVGDVCLKHLKDIKTFDPYRAYISKQDESQKTLQEVLRKSSGFASFIESTKYQTTGIGNIGLRELLMEPVQRIPRYTLLWQSMVKFMSPLSSQRSKLLDAIEIASRIAKCEADAQTVRATVMYCMQRHVDAFPAKLFSNSRDYIDSIDVDDLPVDYPTASPPRPQSYTSSRPVSLASSSSRPLSMTSASSSSIPSLGSNSHLATSPHGNHGQAGLILHCSLFLFDDKLMIVKRQSSSVSGRKVTGLDDVPKLVKTGGGVAVMDKTAQKKDKLSFKGVVDILSVIATDVGNGDFHLFLESPPTDQTERWSGRPFRSLAVVHPPFAISLDPVATRRDKLRFVQNLWAAQASARAKRTSAHAVIPRVLVSDHEIGLERAGELMGRAKCYYNVWERVGWLKQAWKAKVTIVVDESGSAEDLPVDSILVIRLQPLSGGLCRFSYQTLAGDDEDRTVIDMSEVTERIITTIHRFGIFKFRTATTSQPTTPSSTSHRLRPAMLNLDTISRNLFGGSVSGRTSSNDIFSTMSTKRTKSNASKSSTIETNRYSVEMRSVNSKVSTGSDEDNKRYRSQSGSPEILIDTDQTSIYDKYLGQSEVDLNARLNLARKNSRSVASPSKPRGRSVAELNREVEQRGVSEQEIIASYGQLVPPPATAPLRIRNRTPSPARELDKPVVTASVKRTPTLGSAMLSRDLQAMSPREIALPTSPPPRPSSTPTTTPLSPRPQGPRGAATPSTLLGSTHNKLRIVSGGGRRVSAGRETIPLKGEDSSPQEVPSIQITAKRQHSTDQFSPRKRSPSRSPLQPRDEVNQTGSLLDPLHVPSLKGKTGGSRQFAGSRRASNGSRRASATSTTGSFASGATDERVPVFLSEYADLLSAVEATRQKVTDCKVSSGRIKSEIKSLRRAIGRESSKDRRLDRAPSLPRSPQSRNINRRADVEPLRPHDPFSSPARNPTISGRPNIDSALLEETARSLAAAVEKLANLLQQAQNSSEQAMGFASQARSDNSQRSAEIKTLQSQVARAKEHRDLIQQQLADVQLELDVTYEAFNEELDGMYNDVQMPQDEAFQAMRRDLQITKAKRNSLQLENLKMKRDLEEANLKRDEWAKILRSHGILPR